MVMIAIIGCGFGGIAAACELKKRGFSDFTVIDAQSDLGGVWQSQRYPGCAADMPAYLYSFRNHVPRLGDRLVPTRADILEYLSAIVRQHDLAPHFRFGWSVASIEQRNREGHWAITSTTGDAIDAKYLIVATGTTGQPNIPPIAGIDMFEGPVCHTMDWPGGLSIEGKRIAVVGAGASAIQLVPELAKSGALVTVFARTHRWILPKPDFEVADAWRATFDRSAGFRARIGRALERYVDRRARQTVFADPEKLAAMDRKYRHRMRRHIGPWEGTPPLPASPFGCTRTLFSNDYFRAFRELDVTLAPEACEASSTGVRDVDGGEHAADLIVFATGANRFARSLRIRRSDGSDLYEEWLEDPKALAGILPPETPNLFHMSGPNSGVLNSAPRVLDAQAAFVGDLIALAESERRCVVAGEQDVDAFQRSLRPLLDRTIWAGPHCDAWYTRKFSQNPVIWPGTLAEYRAMLAALDLRSLLA